MRIEINHLRILIQRILLQIQARGINMSTEDPHAILERLPSDLKQHEHLFHSAGIHLITCLQLLPGLLHFLQALIPGCPRQTDRLRCAFPLGLSCIQKCLIAS